MQLELFADKRITVQVIINEEALLLDMRKRNFSTNDIGKVQKNLVKGKYNALFVPDEFDGTQGTILLYTEGYEFKLDAEESMQ